VPYYVKRTSQTGVPLPHPVTYPRLSDAMKFACVALGSGVGSGVSDIWIENDNGTCIADRTKIEEFCRLQPQRALE
jgi:hypothetical protein